MKRIELLFIVLPLILLIGCDGDSTTAVSVGPPVTIDTGTVTVGAASTKQLSQFNIGEPGRVDVTLTWTTGPAELTLIVEAQGGAMAANVGGSTLVTSINITQAILDNSTMVAAGVVNNDVVNSAQVQFTVVFTPGG